MAAEGSIAATSLGRRAFLIVQALDEPCHGLESFLGRGPEFGIAGHHPDARRGSLEKSNELAAEIWRVLHERDRLRSALAIQKRVD